MSLAAFQLTGKNALVTGSRRGLGAAIAVALAEAGANVACHGRDVNPGASCGAISSVGRKTFYFSGDLADPTACTWLFEKTIGVGVCRDGSLAGYKYFQRNGMAGRPWCAAS
jgi:2-deoxy-D-gluconate 3-dehydrogenase